CSLSGVVGVTTSPPSALTSPRSKRSTIPAGSTWLNLSRTYSMAVVQGPSSGMRMRVALTPLRTGRGDFITIQGYRAFRAARTTAVAGLAANHGEQAGG